MQYKCYIKVKNKYIDISKISKHYIHILELSSSSILKINKIIDIKCQNPKNSKIAKKFKL